MNLREAQTSVNDVCLNLASRQQSLFNCGLLPIARGNKFLISRCPSEFVCKYCMFLAECLKKSKQFKLPETTENHLRIIKLSILGQLIFF